MVVLKAATQAFIASGASHVRGSEIVVEEVDAARFAEVAEFESGVALALAAKKLVSLAPPGIPVDCVAGPEHPVCADQVPRLQHGVTVALEPIRWGPHFLL